MLILQKTQDFRWSFGPKENCAVIVGSLDNYKALAQSLHHLGVASAESPHKCHTISLRNLRRLHGNCTDIA